MKRHPALVQLSRDHHQSLVFAHGLTRAGNPRLRGLLPREPRAKARAVIQRFQNEQLPHFQLEEERLLPFIKGRDEKLDDMARTVRREHDEMRELIRQLESAQAVEPVLDELGHLLNERKLFVRIQEVLTEEQLDAMGASLARGRR